MQTVEMLRDIVKIQSLSGQEQDVQSYLELYLKNKGLNPFYQDRNLVVGMEGKDRSRAFIFNSHVDVVDPGDDSRWSHGGPWSGTVVDGYMYGRGTSDMKAGVVASVETAVRLGNQGKPPCDVYFTFVVQEETDGAGTRSLADWFQANEISRYAKMAAVFTEPSSLTALQHGHRGNYFIRAQIEGMAGHASRPADIKPHAILTMTAFIDALQKQMRIWKKRFPTGEFMPPTITPTAIEAMTGSPNKVSDRCVATFDLRTIPEHDEEAYAQVEQLARKHGITLSLICAPTPTGYTNPDAAIVRAFQQVVPGLRLEVMQASADLGYLSRIGVEGVIFGPGEIEQAHQINERIAISQVIAAPDIYESVYRQWAAL